MAQQNALRIGCQHGATNSQPLTLAQWTENLRSGGAAGSGDPRRARAGEDCIAKSGTLTFAPGETTKTITIEVKGDSKKESNETFYVDQFNLSSNALFTKNRGLGTILNDD